MVLDVGAPRLPQRPIPPIHHVWVAGPGDGRRFYRRTLFRASGLTFLHQHTMQPS